MQRYPDLSVPAAKFKVQFARMGDPAFNPNVLDVLQELPRRYDAPGLMPCISTVAPQNCQGFFSRLLKIKRELYDKGDFQLQFSCHTTDPNKRDGLIPIRKWDLHQISDYCKKWFSDGDRKVGLNFVMMEGYPVEAKVISKIFSPESCMIKLTPLNPTSHAAENRLRSKLDPEDPIDGQRLRDELKSLGFETIISIGELQENQIGSNCGQFVSALSSWSIRETLGGELSVVGPDPRSLEAFIP